MSNTLRHPGLWPVRLLSPWNFPGKNTGVVCHFILEGVFWAKDWTHVSCTPCIGRWILYHCPTWEAQTANSTDLKTTKFEQLSSGHKDQKRSVFIPIPKKGNAKECSNCHTVVLTLHANEVILKNPSSQLQQYIYWELPDLKLDIEKAEEPEIKLSTSAGS